MIACHLCAGNRCGAEGAAALANVLGQLSKLRLLSFESTSGCVGIARAACFACFVVGKRNRVLRCFNYWQWRSLALLLFIKRLGIARPASLVPVCKVVAMCCLHFSNFLVDAWLAHFAVGLNFFCSNVVWECTQAMQLAQEAQLPLPTHSGKDRIFRPSGYEARFGRNFEPDAVAC